MSWLQCVCELYRDANSDRTSCLHTEAGKAIDGLEAEEKERRGIFELGCFLVRDPRAGKGGRGGGDGVLPRPFLRLSL